MKTFLVYTDGSCWHQDRVGGFAFKVIDEDDKEYSGGGWELDTTISRMELMGPIAALDYILEEFGPGVVLINADSEFVVKGFMDKSRKRNAHSDLWNWLDESAAKHVCVVMEHVRGHVGNADNEDVDALAGKFREEGQQYDDIHGAAC